MKEFSNEEWNAMTVREQLKATEYAYHHEVVVGG